MGTGTAWMPEKRALPPGWEFVEVHSGATWSNGWVKKYYRHESGVHKWHRWEVFASSAAGDTPSIARVRLRMRGLPLADIPANPRSPRTALLAGRDTDIVTSCVSSTAPLPIRSADATASLPQSENDISPASIRGAKTPIATEDAEDATEDAEDASGYQDGAAPHAKLVWQMLSDFQAWSESRRAQARGRGKDTFVGPHGQMYKALHHACEQMIRSTSLLSATFAELMLRSQPSGGGAFTFAAPPEVPLTPSSELDSHGIDVERVDANTAAAVAVSAFCFKEKTIYPDYRRADWDAKLWNPATHVFAARDARGTVFGVMSCYLMRTVAGAWILEVSTLQVNRVSQLECLPESHGVFLGTHFLEQAAGIISRLGGGYLYAQTVTTGRALPFWRYCPLANGPVANILLLQLAHRGPTEVQAGCVPMSWYIPAPA